MMTMYSDAHCAAYAAYKAKGWRCDGLTEAQLDALAEDPNFADEIRLCRRNAAQTKAATDPLSLTDHDFVVLTNYGAPGEATRAYQARQAAQLAIVRPHQPAASAPAALKTKAAAPETMEEWLQRHGTKTVTGAMLVATANEFIEVLKAHKQRVDTLEQANKDLQSRVLELEAVIASRTVEHAGR